MKFTDLTSSQRSMLAALCACNGLGLNTEALGRAATPKMDATSAASSLLHLRTAGLVYSNQKPTGQAYALWKASEYGLAVFMGRPADVQAAQAEPATAAEMVAPAGYKLHSYMIYPGAIGYQGTEQTMLGELAKLAESNPGKQYMAYRKVADAVLPVPQAQITLL